MMSFLMSLHRDLISPIHSSPPQASAVQVSALDAAPAEVQGVPPRVHDNLYVRLCGRSALPSQYEMSGADHRRDRKSTRLNSSHVSISYAVFCLKKKIGRVLLRGAEAVAALVVMWVLREAVASMALRRPVIDRSGRVGALLGRPVPLLSPRRAPL